MMQLKKLLKQYFLEVEQLNLDEINLAKHQGQSKIGSYSPETI
jgi:hypothetical protein